MLALLLVPFVGGRGGRYLLAFLALVPGAVYVTGAPLPLSLPWVMLGTALSQGTPIAAVIALQSLLFAFALLPGSGSSACPRVQAGCLLLAHGALLAALMAVDLLLVLAGLTVASYALLAARLRIARPLPGRLAAVAVCLAGGDLAAYELVLLLAKAAGNAVIPAVAAAGAAIDEAPVVATFAGAVAVSKGALLLVAGRARGAGVPLAALLFLAVPALAWRLQGGPGAVAAVLLVAAGGALALAVAALFVRAGPPLHTLARRLAGTGAASLPGLPAGLVDALGQAELRIGSWRAALGTMVFLALVLLVATGGGAG